MEVKPFKDDVERLSPLIKTWRAESNAGDFGMEIDSDRLLGHAEFLRDCPDAELLVMESKEGRVLGVMGLVVVPNIIERGQIVNEHIWYVLPEHRSKASLVLIKKAESWGRDKECSHFIINASKLISDLHDRMCLLYNRLGFRLFETTYIRKL